jgi:hypothetical protein
MPGNVNYVQTSVGREKKHAIPLQPVEVEGPFEQWGLESSEKSIPILHSSTNIF